MAECDNKRSEESEREEAGVSTIFACLCVALFLVVTGIGMRLGGVMLAREQAETAADLGALAGAAHILLGSDQACGRARVVVEANRATLVSCTAQGLDVLLEVRTPSWGGAAHAHARAGPVSAG